VDKPPPLPTRPWARTLTRAERLHYAGLASVCIAVLAVAAALTPDPRGHGTHEKLGMPPCLTATLFHIPCPFCGMTTSFAWMAHGHPRKAFTVQPAGVLGFVATAFAAPLFASLALTGLRLPRAPRNLRRWAWCTVLIVLGAGWLYSILHFVP